MVAEITFPLFSFTENLGSNLTNCKIGSFKEEPVKSHMSNFTVNFFFDRRLDEEIRTSIRGQTEIGHDGREVS